MAMHAYIEEMGAVTNEVTAELYRITSPGEGREVNVSMSVVYHDTNTPTARNELVLAILSSGFKVVLAIGSDDMLWAHVYSGDNLIGTLPAGPTGEWMPF